MVHTLRSAGFALIFLAILLVLAWLRFSGDIPWL